MWLPAGVDQGRCCFNSVTALTKKYCLANHGLAIISMLLVKILRFFDLRISLLASQWLDIYR